jgi:protein-ribulosamine 3-kinase
MKHLQKVISWVFNKNITIESIKQASGGCICESFILSLSNSQKVFLKQSPIKETSVFIAEKKGLELLKCQDGPQIPTPLGIFQDDKNEFLVLKYIQRGSTTGKWAEKLGRKLAIMHQCQRSEHWGLDTYNYIGKTIQPNEYKTNWIEFFATMRLKYQADLACKNNLADKTMLKGLFYIIENLDQFLLEPKEKPTLIHGDLWTGNAMANGQNEPVIFDPAVYYGHREAEIAMTQLFGSFPYDFYQAYNEYWPLEPGYKERFDIYNLYHLLNHLNIFGHGYKSSVMSVIDKFTS